MTSEVTCEEKSESSVWVQDGKWKGAFFVSWLFLKDIPNKQFRHILIEANENKPVTNSRDTQEVPLEHGRQMIEIFRNFRHSTSIIDDFDYYLKRESEMKQKRDHKYKGNNLYAICQNVK